MDFSTMAELVEVGYSRVPIHASGESSENIDKYLMVKELIPIDPKESIRVDAKAPSGKPLLQMYAPVWIGPTQDLFELLNRFQTGCTHMAFGDGVSRP